MPSRSKSTRKTRRSSISRAIEVRGEGRESSITNQRRANVGVVGRLQGVEDIVFGAVGELGRTIVGDKKGARKSAEIFEDGVDTLLGRKNNESARAGGYGSLSRRSIDINLLRDTYFEGYDAGIHAGLSRAEAEASWYNQPRQMQMGNGGSRAALLPKTTFGNAKALEQGRDSELTSIS
ncbi:hypothetical protein TWF281_006789 [Arthrobotrys megalospora]